MWWLTNDYCAHCNHKGLLRGEPSAGEQNKQEKRQPQREAERELEVDTVSCQVMGIDIIWVQFIRFVQESYKTRECL
jgi:hypothetical protein